MLMLIGVNHRTAPVAIRDHLYLSAAALPAALDALLAQPEVREALILSTCNRTEIYTVGGDPADLLAWLARHAGFTPDALEPYLYQYEDDGVARHLFRVAAGLDSLVVGETQIAGQLGEALDAARENGASRRILTALFQSALAAGKRARTETAISEGIFSVGGVAVELARALLPDLAQRAVLVLGAGKMSELTARHLVANGAHPLYVANRTFEHAEEVAARLGGTAVHYDELKDRLVEVDILISSTGAPHLVLHRDTVARAVEQRGGRPLVLIDIAVPRDIDPDAGTLPGVRLYDLDALDDAAQAHTSRRHREIPRVEALLDDEMTRWRQRLAGLEAAEIISALQDSFDRVRADELARIAGTLESLSPEQRQAVEGMTASLINKLLHLPIVRLKDAICRDRGEALPLFCEFFDLEAPGE